MKMSALESSLQALSNDDSRKLHSPDNISFYSRNPYQKLDKAKHDIRLLKLLPPKDTADTIFNFEIVDKCDLTEYKSKYIAFSYAAGNPTFTTSIRVNGHAFNAFANLDHAIRDVVSFCNRTELDIAEQLFWVDQICINNADTEERSHQIRHMRKIYSNARAAFICLTEKARPENSQAFSFLLKVAKQVEIINKKITSKQRLLKTTGEAGEDAEEAFREQRMANLLWWIRNHAISPSSKLHAEWLDMCDMLSAGWWSRGWVCQEFILAPEAHFLFGGSHLAGSAMISFKAGIEALVDLQIYLGSNHSRPTYFRLSPSWAAKRLLKKPGWRSIDLETAGRKIVECRLDAAAKLMGLKEAFDKQDLADNKPRSFDLVALLDDTRHCKTSDPRDRIFAFLSLAHSCYRIPVDYMLSSHQILARVAKEVLQLDQSSSMPLDLLSRVAMRKEKAQHSQLPSWVPDWSDQWRPKTNPTTPKGFDHVPTDIYSMDHYMYGSYSRKVASTSRWDSFGLSTWTRSVNYKFGPYKFPDVEYQYCRLSRDYLTLQVRGICFGTISGVNHKNGLFTSKNIGFPGWCNSDAVTVGDQLWLLIGDHFPYVLRAEENFFLLVGQARVDLGGGYVRAGMILPPGWQGPDDQLVYLNLMNTHQDMDQIVKAEVCEKRHLHTEDNLQAKTIYLR